MYATGRETMTHRSNLASHDFFVTTILLKHSHTHLLTHFLWLFSHYNDRVENLCHRPYVLHMSSSIYYLASDGKVSCPLISAAYDGHLDCFQFGAFKNSAALNITEHVSG